VYGARLRPTTFVPVLPTSLRSDTHGGVNVGELTAGVVGILVVVLILTALLPTIIDAIDNSKWALWAFVDSNKPATSPCDTCVGPWHAYFNFAEGQHTWFPGLQQGVYTAAYQPGNGWTATNWIEPVGDDPNTRALIYMAFTGAANLTGVNVVLGGLALDGGLQSSSWVVVFGGRYGSPLATVASAHGAGDYPGTFNQSYPGEQGIAIDVRCSDDQYGGATLISGLHLYGVDLPPQEIVENATLFEYL